LEAATKIVLPAPPLIDVECARALVVNGETSVDQFDDVVEAHRAHRVGRNEAAVVDVAAVEIQQTPRGGGGRIGAIVEHGDRGQTAAETGGVGGDGHRVIAVDHEVVGRIDGERRRGLAGGDEDCGWNADLALVAAHQVH
jgi:hypothetical protein